MAMPGAEDIKKLKGFIEFVQANPTILNVPQLDFVKKFIEGFGGKIPDGDFKMPTGGKCPFAGSAESDPKVSEESDSEVEEIASDSESEIELDNEGVIEGDDVTDLIMGDSSKTPTEEEVDQASAIRSEAAQAYSEQKFQEAIDLYTKAIELNPGNALFHAKRGQAFLKLQKPVACIHDCDKALELNCDSAAAYKFRGRAHRLLGNWESAAKDLRQACKLDFDEEANDWLSEVTPNAKKIEQHRVKLERKKLEKARKVQEAAVRAAQKRRERQQKEQAKSGNAGDGFAGGFPGGFPGGVPSFNGSQFNDFMSNAKDPEVQAAFEDIMKNPANIEKYKSNPKIAKLIAMIQGMKGGSGGFPNFGGFPGFPGGAPDDGANGKETPTAEPKKPEPKKPDFMDDGLD
ncbi:hsc70-interacting protein 1-like [Teleopsis dalmanni]|uniref:hsc70-interacting protein 1-like n=1 Tax=Teleopsis dalmanni TaxID=139649 RepID=UPI0018CE7C12|nr:hsc70-interacting protein 1-like [Teleopsis dalmanni]XP_037937700.1 hsc70-interacting protein 1-like [Teleopsis dalmanni]